MAKDNRDAVKMAYIRVTNTEWKAMLRSCGILGIPHRSRIVMGNILHEKFLSGKPFTAKECGDELKKRLRTGMSASEKSARAVNESSDEDAMTEFFNNLSPERKAQLMKLQTSEKKTKKS
jgi:hypothetical protein